MTRYLVTGAGGFVGSAVVQELLASGYQVLGLARSENAAKVLAATGAEVLRGSIDDHELIKDAARRTDGVVHCAFNHDFSTYLKNCDDDEAVIRAFGEALAGTNKPIVVTSGVGVAIPTAGQPVKESDVLGTQARAKSEVAIPDLVAQGVRAMAIRLPPSVHGPGDKAFVPALIGIAKSKGVAAYVGEGTNVWSSVHRLDAAVLFRLALEKGEAGHRFHAVHDTGIPLKELAFVIAKRLGVQTKSITKEEAGEHFGWMGHFSQFDVLASSEATKAELGWSPKEIGLLQDLEEGSYFE